MINAASFHPFFFKVKANVQSSPLFAKTLIYFSLFFALPLNVLLKLDEKTLFCPFDVFTRFQWYRTFSSLLYVNSGFIGALFNAYISYRFISDFERSLGSFRCFWQILFTLVCINCWTFVFSVVFAPFSGRERTLTLTVEHFWTGRFICHVRNVRGEYREEQQYE